MKDFIINLYSNENFPIILGLFIIILVIAFIMVYYWGRKDQKLIETRKLEKINLENNKDKEKAKHDEDDNTKELPLEKEDNKDEEISEIEETPKKEAFKEISKEEKLEVEKPKEELFEFEATSTIELPKLNEENNKKVNIADFERISNRIDKELKDLEEMQKKSETVKVQDDEIDYLYEDTAEMELPKLKK